MWQELLSQLRDKDIRALARSISLVENEVPGYDRLLKSLRPEYDSKIIGVTGAPGAGKSTLVDALIGELIKSSYKVGVLCVDPSSPFNFGALLGDRIRMSEWYSHPTVFIRSLATRGALGGLHPKIIEITDLLKEAAFDFIIVETVGVGQSEIEIAGIADTTLVVLVPEGGDEIQTMKAGIMEIADIFVVNKSDRPGASDFLQHLHLMLSPASKRNNQTIPILKTVASEKKGIGELLQVILDQQHLASSDDRKHWLLAEQAFHLIQKRRMLDVRKESLMNTIKDRIRKGNFNLYNFIEEF